jgi:hypothetical protein
VYLIADNFQEAAKAARRFAIRDVVPLNSADVVTGRKLIASPGMCTTAVSARPNSLYSDALIVAVTSSPNTSSVPSGDV